MKTINQNIKILCLSLLLIIAACSPNEGYEDYTVEKSSVSEMASDWWVIALEPDGVTPAYGGNYVIVTTSNTADDNGSTMLIDDHQNWFEFRTKINANVSDLTFTSSDNIELYYDGEIQITNGSITRGSYTTPTGRTVDEIYFEVEVDWDPGTVYIFKGFKRTGFLEDEDPNY